MMSVIAAVDDCSLAACCSLRFDRSAAAWRISVELVEIEFDRTAHRTHDAAELVERGVVVPRQAGESRWQIGQARAQVRLRQIVQLAADLGHRLLAILIAGFLGDRGVAEHQDGARHIAQFVHAIRIGHGDVVAASGQVGHRLGQVRDRTGDELGQRHGQEDREADERDATDRQRDERHANRGLLAGRIGLDRRDLRVTN
ncbi:MAG: hypothetical protein QM756_20280 [Polyangiaceae bacterium]